MEAKKKAEEIIKKIFNEQHKDDKAILIMISTEKIALFLVDEIITTSMTGYLLNDSVVAEFQIKMRDYWKEVKQEIEKYGH